MQSSSFCSPSDFYNYLNGILMLLIIVGGMLTVARFSFAGLRYMISDNPGTQAKARSQIWACVWGLVLLISSMLILNTINPQIVSGNLSSLYSLASLVQGSNVSGCPSGSGGYYQVAPNAGQ